MQINSVSAGHGLQWLIEGARLLRRQPLGLPAMVVVYLLMLLVPALIPLVGLAFSGVLSPFATVGLMQCVREVSQGRAPSPAQFARPFQDERNRVQLFRLGLINAGLVLLVAVAATLIAPPAPAVEGQAAVLPLQTMLVQMLLYLPVLVVMWFAPLLAAWHGAPPGKAMFGSAVACLRNVGALLVYGVAAAALVGSVSFVLIGVLAALIASRELLSFAVAPIALLLMSVVQASFYPMYVSIFEATARDAAARAIETA